MDSIPAYFNMIHASESEAGYDPDNIPIAPMESWVEWRDHSFTRELDTWRKHLEYWADRYKSSDRLVISYERFIDPAFGPESTGNIAEFLSRMDGITTVPAEEVPCIWHKVVTKELAAEAAACGHYLGEVKPDSKARKHSGKDNPEGKEHLRRRLQIVPPQQQQSSMSQQKQVQQPSLSQSRGSNPEDLRVTMKNIDLSQRDMSMHQQTQSSGLQQSNTQPKLQKQNPGERVEPLDATRSAPGPKQDDQRKSMDSSVTMKNIEHSQRDTSMQQQTQSSGMQQSNTQPQMKIQHHGERAELRDAKGSSPDVVGLHVDAVSNAVGQLDDKRSRKSMDSSVTMKNIEHSQRDTSMQQQTQSSGMQQSNTQPQMKIQHHGERAELRDAKGSSPDGVGRRVDAESNSVGQETQKAQQSIQYHEKKRETGSGGGNIPTGSVHQDVVKVHTESDQQENVRVVSDVAKPVGTTVEKAGESISVIMSKVQQTKVLQDELSGRDKVTIGEVKGVDKTVIKKSGESISQLINRVQQTNDKDEELTQREDTSEMMDEPSCRPYTGEQRKDIVIMLTQLLEKYGTDNVLTPLMVNYIDAVERRVKLSKGLHESTTTMGL